MTLMNPVATIHVLETLDARHITRSDRDVDYAIQGALEMLADEAGVWADADFLIDRYPDAWHDALHREHGIYDRLDVDSEDLLYDRMENAA